MSESSNIVWVKEDQIDKLIEELFNTPTQKEEKNHDDEFVNMAIRYKELLSSLGFIEADDAREKNMYVDFVISDEHSGDRTLSIEIQSVKMAYQHDIWMYKTQIFLKDNLPSYQILGTTLFSDPKGSKLLPGYAVFLIRENNIFGFFSTRKVAKAFGAA